MRDRVLLHIFLEHLHKTGALSVPPEDLISAVDIVAERFVIAENGGPGYEALQNTKATTEEIQRLQTSLEELEEEGHEK